MKKCCRCEKIYDETFFRQVKDTKDKLSSWCKPCFKEYKASWAKNNPDKIKDYESKPSRRQQKLITDKKYRGTSKAKKRRAAYENTPKRKQYTKIYNKNYQSNPVNREKRNISRRVKYRTNPTFKLSLRLRNRINKLINKLLNKSIRKLSAVRDLGCTIEEYKLYIESLFQPGMTWENWTNDGWHIDHIRPLSSFDLTDPVQLKAAVHYTNTQPMWAKENLSKGSKYGE